MADSPRAPNGAVPTHTFRRLCAYKEALQYHKARSMSPWHVHRDIFFFFEISTIECMREEESVALETMSVLGVRYLRTP